MNSYKTTVNNIRKEYIHWLLFYVYQTSLDHQEACVWRTTGQTTSLWCGTIQSQMVARPSPTTSLKSVTCLDRRGSKLALSMSTALSSKQPTCLKASSILSEFMQSTRLAQASKLPNLISHAKPKCLLVIKTYWVGFSCHCSFLLITIWYDLILLHIVYFKVVYYYDIFHVMHLRT